MEDTVFCAVNDKAVEVGVGSTHRDLEGVMQVSDHTVSTNQSSALDRWADFTQQNTWPIHLGGGDISMHGDTLASSGISTNISVDALPCCHWFVLRF